MPRQNGHDVILRPLGNGQARDIIATVTAQKAVPALFEDLKADDWQDRIAAMHRLRSGADGLLELAQPMHRRFQFALFEVVCDRPGHPRLDPERIESAGIVIRRQRGAARLGWLRTGKRIEGWKPLLDSERDPDPVRAEKAHPANAALRGLIAARRGGSETPEETVHTLFTAPPDVCAAVGKTILFAPVPVASSELSDEPPPPIDFLALPPAETTELVDHLSGYFKHRSRAKRLPHAGDALSPEWNVLSSEANADLHAFGLFLHQCASELDLFGSAPSARSLRRLLSRIELPLEVDAAARPTKSIDATAFLRDAAAILLTGEPNAKNLHMPLSWPAIDSEKAEQLTRAALACLSDQHARVSPPVAKFSNDAHQYVVRGFIRVSGHEDCPEKLVWSIESEPFRIAPWWDGDGPPVSISLPDLGKLKKSKPSVSFAMPPEIANLLNGNAKDLSEGKGSTNGPGIAWLCSFSIPYITICAFIVLNIFLSLFDIIFRWMLYIKVCIPIPAPPPSADEGGGG
ncbi:hypothetical protein [Novosphingobium beihaiensis]|uniref:Uncharacterized protein n=1 Tax=Novosphingobium beihaiensis TaxID=2930389 RepID=A0ABT0BNF8_9SPHN|nr:hypothetical protein [Novosphingobium beihaiensis]MCJ2186495.1 hypothetical protein [Novosphingobium beihaiensis]